MKVPIEISKAQLKVLSAICSNIAAGWLFIIFTTRGIIPLTGDIILAIFFWRMAVKIEEILEDL